MDPDLGRVEAPCGNRLLDPQQNVVARAATVVAKIMIERDFCDLPRLEHSDRFIGPVGTPPASRSLADVVKMDFHFRFPFHGYGLSRSCYIAELPFAPASSPNLWMPNAS